ncbi:MAG TPA: CDP-archaeol synthase [Candidatus Nanoarchaeia archaeon]|nr:CDP-archaeol synthase [Candidatus Nanoarchaeia archaeon]
MIIFKVIYFLVPYAFANMAPVLVKNYFKGLAYPLDSYKALFGKRVLGDHKTWRGLIFGIIGGIFGSLLQLFLAEFSFFQQFMLFPITKSNVLLYGFLIGLGAIVGDAVGSFIKRRINVSPGQSLVPLDQFVGPVGVMIFLLPLYNVTVPVFFLALVVSFFFHLIIKRIGYFFKIENKKW